MPKYKNLRTGAVIVTASFCSGGCWVELTDKKPAEQKPAKKPAEKKATTTKKPAKKKEE